jgi:hypothetical protein
MAPWKIKKKVTLDLCLLKTTSARTGRTKPAAGQDESYKNLPEEKYSDFLWRPKQKNSLLNFRKLFDSLSEKFKN